MPTELTEHEVVDALRAMRPDVDTPDGWEAEQRVRLLTFIETGVIRDTQAVSAPGEAPVVPLDGARRDDGRRGVAVVLATAAAAVVLVGGLVIAPRWRGAETPPATAPPVTRDVPPADEQLLPDVFPILPDDHPLADVATAAYGGMTTWEQWPLVEALVGIEQEGLFDDATLLQVRSRATLDGFVAEVGATGERAVLADVAGTIYVEPGDPAITTFVSDGDPARVVRGRDVVAFVRAAGTFPIADVESRSDGSLAFDVARLPDGYSVAIEPYRWDVAAEIEATTVVPAASVQPPDGTQVRVQRSSPLRLWEVDGGIEFTDVNGVRGWRHDWEFGFGISWPVGDHAWAQVIGAPEVGFDDVIAFARSVQFVDRVTWEQRYDVEPLSAGDLTVTSIDVTATSAPGDVPGSTGAGVADERECHVIGVEPLGRDVVPLGSVAPAGGAEPFVLDPGGSRRIEIDCVAADGVRVGMPVTFESGLIGKVTQMADDTSVVMLVGDSQFFALADVPEAAAAGSVRGSGSDGGAEIRFIERDDAESIESGMLVVTTGGERSLAPAGIPIGRIVGPGSDDGSFDIDLWSPSPGTGATVSVVLHVPDADRVDP